MTNYAIGLNKSIAEKDHQIGLVDMAMFLIVMKHLIQFTNRKVVFKVSVDNNYESVLYPLNGKLTD